MLDYWIYISLLERAMAGPAPDVDRGLSNRELAAAITELAGHLNAATRRWLALIAEFDRRKGWSDSVTQSCAHWLNWQCGLALGAAREKVRVAHALEELPLIGAAMGRGELSYWKVREVTRVATPATEKFLLDIALHGTAATSKNWCGSIDGSRKSRLCREKSGNRLDVHSATTSTMKMARWC